MLDRTMKKSFFLSMLAAMMAVSSEANIIVTQNSDANALTSALVAANSGLTIIGSVLTGPDGCSAIFSNAKSAAASLPDQGIVLSSGGPESLDLQDSGSQTTCYSTPGDSQLDALAQAQTQDACILEIEFKVNPTVVAVEFKYVFGSDEYTEYVASVFNDAFGLFLNGVNLALVPSSTTPVSINTINQFSNSGYFVNNDVSPPPFPLFEADGFTKELTATGLVNAGTNTLKLAVADASDCAWDSWVLIKGKSLRITKSGGMEGDPHILLWNGNWLDFQGECDMVLVDAPEFYGDLGLLIHVRTTIRYSYSYIESAVIRIGDSTLEVDSFGQHFVDGVEAADLTSPLVTLSGFPIVYTSPSPKEHVFEINISPVEKIVVKAFKDIVSVMIHGATESNFHNSVGIMGSFTDAGAMLARDKTTKIEDPVLFAQEWQVRADEPKLFHTIRSPQAPMEQCRLPSADVKENRRLLNSSVTKEAAESACAHVRGAGKKACVFDVMSVGDVDIAKVGTY